jgi:hypothetical protein
VFHQVTGLNWQPITKTVAKMLTGRSCSRKLAAIPPVHSLGSGLAGGSRDYDSVFSGQVFWIDVKKINCDAGQAVRKLKVIGNFDLTGEVSAESEEAEILESHEPEE